MRPVAAVIALVSLAGACKTAHKSEPILHRPIVLDTRDEMRGQLVFMEHCNQCHPQGAGGLGPPLNNVKLPEPVVKLKVRQGYPLMPGFDEQHISDAELDDLVEYLAALRAR